jgi:hypothetical protein
MVISLTARGLTTGDVSAHMAEVYGADVSRDTFSRIADRVIAEMSEWHSRPLDRVYPVIFIDAIVVKIRDGLVTNRPVYTAIGVTVDGERDILGLWVGSGGEGAKFWLQVLTEIKNRGVEDVCIVVCDGLKGLPEAIEAAWSLAIVQPCALDLIRNTFRFASKAYWDQMARDLRPVYTAVSEHERFVEFGETSGEVSGERAALGERLDRVRSLLGLLTRDPQGDLFHQRGGIAPRSDAASDPRSRPFPHRTGGAQMSLLGGAQSRPHRQGKETLDEPMEGCTQRLRHHLRRPHPSHGALEMPTAVTPKNGQSRPERALSRPGGWDPEPTSRSAT